MTYRLYYSPGACSMAPHIVLEEIGVPFEAEIVWTRDEGGGTRTSTPEWHAINPKGRVPALAGVPGSVGGAENLLTEVPAILFYLASRYPEAELLPVDAAAQARCLEWMNWLSSNLHATAYAQMRRSHRFSADERHYPAISDKGREALLSHHAYIERLLGDGREWAVGNRYSIVDAYLFVFYWWGQRIGIAMGRSQPAWSALTTKLLARPAVQRVLAREKITIAVAESPQGGSRSPEEANQHSAPHKSTPA